MTTRHRQRKTPADNPGSPEEIEVHAQDGTRLSMRRFRGAGPAVLLLHGLAARSLIFDLPGRSLAQWLAQNDFDVFVPELRGHGASEWPGHDWGLREYLTLDIPALIDAICATSGRDALHWIGHSMGGILLLCHSILSPDPRIASALTIGSALTLRHGDCFYKKYIPFKPLFSHFKKIPVGAYYRCISPLIGRDIFSNLTRPTVWPKNIEGDFSRRLHRDGFCSAPITLLLDLIGCFDERGLSIRDVEGKEEFHFWENRRRCALALRMFAASRDVNVPAASVIQTARALNRENSLTIFGKDFGCEEEYGHCDLIVGKNAAREVWPKILAWLRGEWRPDAPNEDLVIP